MSAKDCPAIMEPSYTLHFTREGYQTLGESYAAKMLELLKAQEVASDTATNDTAKVDSVITDSVKTDSSAQDSTIAIKSLSSIRAMESNEPKLYFDNKEQALFVRVKKNGREFRYRVTGRKN